MLPYPLAAALTAATVVACAAWLHASAAATGRPSLPAVAASLAANLLATLLFDQPTCYVTRGTLAFLFLWLASSKALAFRCGRGPLAQQPWSRAQFLALYALPLLPAPPGAAAAAPSGSLLRRSATKAAVTVSALGGLALGPPQVVRELLYALAMYGWLGLQMDSLGSLALPCLGLRLEPHFRPPWQARSISAFWGRHWNLAASCAVRTTVYEPIVEGCWVRQRQPPRRAAAAKPLGGGAPAAAGRPARSALALCAACLASGVVHEIVVWCIAGATTKGAWLAFFALQASGPLVLAEGWVLDWLARRGVKPPPPLRVAATLSTLLLASHFLFFKPVERLPLIHQFVDRMARNFAAVRAATGW